jgi:hypothetical protein
MTHTRVTHKLVTVALVVAATFALSASSAEAAGDQQRRRQPSARRAVPRAVAPPVIHVRPRVHIRPRVVWPQVVAIVPHRHDAPRYRPNVYYGYPAYNSRRGYGYAYAPPPGYHAFVPGRSYGGVRIDLPQRDAQVYVGGYFVGTVDEFDGVFQQLNLEPGPHRIEVRADGYEPIVFDIRVQPGRTITYRASMHPLYR